jgi:myosin-crossreactive antigen
MQHTDQSKVKDASVEPVNTKNNISKAYFVGGGIASLAGAAFLIRDGLIHAGLFIFLRSLRLPAVAWMEPVQRNKSMSCGAAG